MELPKNVTQIGETDKFCKIYMEDYVVSYMKQMNRLAEDKTLGLALYGKYSAEENISYYFVYGAAKLNYLQREVKHLSQAQNQEIERLHRKYFADCEFVGYVLLNGDMIEGIWLMESMGCRYVKGYACFYEKNDCMLAYMLDSRAEETPPEEVSQEKYDEVRKRQEERKQEYTERDVKVTKVRSGSEVEQRMRGMRFAAASMFVLLCLVTIITWQTEGADGKTGTRLKNIFSELGGNEEEQDAVEVMGSDVVNTLVAEDQLAEAIRQENEKAQMQTTPEPMIENTPEPMITPVPTPEPTPTPTATPIPTPEPTTAPVVTPQPDTVPAQSEVSYETYIIKKGDTLREISLEKYGSVRYVEAICQLNNISNPDNIQMGQKILLP